MGVSISGWTLGHPHGSKAKGERRGVSIHGKYALSGKHGQDRDIKRSIVRVHAAASATTAQPWDADEVRLRMRLMFVGCWSRNKQRPIVLAWLFPKTT